MDFFSPIKKLIHRLRSKREEQAKLQSVVPEKSLNQSVDETKAMLPNILHTDWEYKLSKGIEREVVNMHELKKAFDLPLTKAYAVRA